MVQLGPAYGLADGPANCPADDAANGATDGPNDGDDFTGGIEPVRGETFIQIHFDDMCLLVDANGLKGVMMPVKY